MIYKSDWYVMKSAQFSWELTCGGVLWVRHLLCTLVWSKNLVRQHSKKTSYVPSVEVRFVVNRMLPVHGVLKKLTQIE